MSHILIVDDDDKIRELLKEFLTENNFLISTAADATALRNRTEIIYKEYKFQFDFWTRKTLA